MLTGNAEGQMFKDTAGNNYQVSAILSMARNSAGNTVSMMGDDGQHVTVEITPTEAISIIEYYNYWK